MYGEYYLLSYKNGSGEASLDKFGKDGSYSNVWQQNWATGWTTLAPFELFGKCYLLPYQAETGTAELGRFDFAAEAASGRPVPSMTAKGIYETLK